MAEQDERKILRPAGNIRSDHLQSPRAWSGTDDVRHLDVVGRIHGEATPRSLIADEARRIRTLQHQVHVIDEARPRVIAVRQHDA